MRLSHNAKIEYLPNSSYYIGCAVRQENERIQESLNRGKYIKNFTHVSSFVAAAAPYTGGDQHP